MDILIPYMVHYCGKWAFLLIIARVVNALDCNESYEGYEGVGLMEKNRIRPVKYGKGVRMSYARQEEVLEMPNLIEIQKASYEWFLTDGLREVFNDISPIVDHNENMSLDFVDFRIARDSIRYTIEECKERDATYAAPLNVDVILHNKTNDEIIRREIFMGDMPLMTEDKFTYEQLMASPFDRLKSYKDRPNLIGKLKGKGGGKSLIINGHEKTTHSP